MRQNVTNLPTSAPRKAPKAKAVKVVIVKYVSMLTHRIHNKIILEKDYSVKSVVFLLPI